MHYDDVVFIELKKRILTFWAGNSSMNLTQLLPTAYMTVNLTLNLSRNPRSKATKNYEYGEATVIAVNGDRDHPRKLKIREVAAPL